MAVGPFARILAQIVVPVVAVLARALPAAYSQALQNARKAGVDATEAAAPVFGKRISRSEALQILNLTEASANPEAIQKVRNAYKMIRILCGIWRGDVVKKSSLFVVLSLLSNESGYMNLTTDKLKLLSLCFNIF